MNSALVVVDVQESFRLHPLWQVTSNPDIVNDVHRLAAAARDNGDLVVWVLDGLGSTGTLFDPAAEHVRPMAGVERAEHLIGQGATIESAARAVGFADVRMLRRLRARPWLGCPA